MAATECRERAAPLLLMGGVDKSFGAGVRGCSAEVRVLAGAALVVGAGEIVGVAGEPGSGKSTLLLCAAGRVRPERGSVAWYGLSAVAAGVRAHTPRYLDLRDAFERREMVRALEAEAGLLLLDHARPALLEELRVAIIRSPRRSVRAIVIASRSSAELARVASRVLVMREGRLRSVGPVAGARGAAPQRNRSAARARSAFPSSLARARIRST